MALGPRFTEALPYAAQLHRDQVRKGSGVPYVSHLLAVAGLVIEHGGTEEEAIAALLHDAVEDQGGALRLEEIRQRFGETVAAIVEGCSDTDEMPKPPWRPRKETYIAHLASSSPSVRLVSAADKLHNARTILADYRRFGDSAWTRFSGGKDGTLWYYRALVEAFRAHGMNPLVEDLERVVGELEQLIASDRHRGR